jgi:hypothetical protein
MAERSEGVGTCGRQGQEKTARASQRDRRHRATHRSAWLIALSFLFGRAWAQQNFFNVPSSDITKAHGVFFQQQANVLSDGVQSNTTLTYGLGSNLEVGVNFLGVALNNREKLIFNDTVKPYSPLAALNVQKKIPCSEQVSFGIGGQFGLDRLAKGGAYVYANSIVLLPRTGTKVVMGLYTSSDGFFGKETRNVVETETLRTVGIQSGVEQRIWRDKLTFQADFISGKHSLGQLVVGAAFSVTKNWVISSGYQIPTFNSLARNGVVLELTYLPK